MSKLGELESVRLWVDRYSSVTLRERYLKDLEAYCAFQNKDPDELLEIKRTQKEPVAEKMLDKFALEWNRPESVKVSAIKAIRSFYLANYLDLAKRAGSGTKYRRVKPIRNPTQAQLREMCLGRHIRDIAMINVFSSSGFREETLSRLDWSHALESWAWNGIDPVHIPVMGDELKGGGLGKYRDLEQHAFLVPHATRMLLKYKDWRESRGEKIRDESPLFATLTRSPRRLNTRIIRFILESACNGKPFVFSPHDLRRFTQTQLEQARVQPNWIRKMLGKKVGGEEAPYSQPKLEQLREAFRAAIPFLTLEPEAQVSEFDRRKQNIQDQVRLLYAGDPARMDAALAMFEGCMTIEQLNDALGRHVAKRGKTVIVPESKLDNHLNHGWVFVACLPSGMCILREGP
jgi:integrase